MHSASSKARTPSIHKVLQTYAKANNLPMSLCRTVSGAIRSRDAERLKQVKLDFGSPQLYRDPITYKRYAYFIALFSKFSDISFSNTQEAAISKFSEVCYHVSSINAAFDNTASFSTRTRLVLDKSYNYIRRNFRYTDISNLALAITRGARHGPGASQQCTGREATRFHKWAAPMVGTDGAYALASIDEVVRLIATEISRTPNYTSRARFVPKTIWTDRQIAIENGLSVYYQLGVNSVLRRRLEQNGTDIRNQVSNQVLAKHGSMTGEFATIDLSSASDTVSSGLVRNLFEQSSPALYKLMTSLRSTELELLGVNITMPMYSTMGNGYTFALETLIFKSLIEGVRKMYGSDEPYAVYGDDIIVHRSVAGYLCEVLEEVGFITNPEKTFLEGPFRESCGCDYWLGSEVRPVFVKTLKDPHKLIPLINLMRRQPEYQEVCTYLKGFVENFGPLRDEVNGWVHEDDESLWTSRYNKHHQAMAYRESCEVGIDFRREFTVLMSEQQRCFGVPLRFPEHTSWSDRLEYIAYLCQLSEPQDEGQSCMPRKHTRIVNRWTTWHG